MRTKQGSLGLDRQEPSAEKRKRCNLERVDSLY
jgi:hypothetical protein